MCRPAQLPSPPFSRTPPVCHPHVPPSVPQGRCEMHMTPPGPVVRAVLMLSQWQHPLLPGAFPGRPTALLCLPLPQGQGGGRGSGKPASVRHPRCIMTLLMGWVENSVGKQCNTFYEDSSPPGQGLGRLPTADPTWHRFWRGSGSHALPQPHKATQDSILRAPGGSVTEARGRRVPPALSC